MVVGTGVNQTFSITVSSLSDDELNNLTIKYDLFFDELEYLGTINNESQTKTYNFYSFNRLFNYILNYIISYACNHIFSYIRIHFCSAIIEHSS